MSLILQKKKKKIAFKGHQYFIIYSINIHDIKNSMYANHSTNLYTPNKGTFW
jgi:hypothetical protein